MSCSGILQLHRQHVLADGCDGRKLSKLANAGAGAVIGRRLAAFVHAGRGIVVLLRTQVHAWFHLLATIVVTMAGFLFDVTATQWCALVLATGLVWAAEAMNTAVEFVVDLVSPEYHELAGKAKDTAAAAVLLAACAAAVVGGIVFGPHLYGLVAGPS